MTDSTKLPDHSDPAGAAPRIVVAVAGGPLGDGSAPREVAADEPLLLADDLGAVRGDGVFDSLLLHRGRPLKLPRHLVRIEHSARMLGIECPADEVWTAGIEVARTAWERAAGGVDGVLRLVLSRGPEHLPQPRPTAWITVAPVSAHVHHVRGHGLRLKTLDRGFDADTGAAAPWLLIGAKTVSYAVNMAATRCAQAAGFDDALFVSSDGVVLEGPRSTLVLVRDGGLVTPPQQVGVLAGTTVGALFELAGERGIATSYERVTLADVQAADAAWFVSSVTMAAQVTAVDEHPMTGVGDSTERPGPTGRTGSVPDVAALVAEAVGWTPPAA